MLKIVFNSFPQLVHRRMKFLKVSRNLFCFAGPLQKRSREAVAGRITNRYSRIRVFLCLYFQVYRAMIAVLNIRENICVHQLPL